MLPTKDGVSLKAELSSSRVQKLRSALARTQSASSTDCRLAHLDGLRAIALISVLLFHFKIPFGEGGFLGVDMFFVLSGFLMTRALLMKVDSGTFSLRKFLTARAKRICPAHLVTVLLTLIATVFIFPVTMHPQVAESSASASLFVSNMKFLSENGYHDTASTLKPLLHTWSLAVEAQFYILWSFLALLGSLERVSSVMVALCAASLAFQNLASENGAALFFCSWSRLYEFGAGAAALLMYDSMSPRISSFLGLLGCVGISASVVLARPDHAPIALISLPAVLGTAFVISSPRGLVSRHLGRNRLLAYIGKISYSVYLVHWPAIVLFSFVMDDEQLASCYAFLATLILSPILFTCVEDAFRARREARMENRGILFSFLTLITILGASIVVGQRATSRINRIEASATATRPSQPTPPSRVLADDRKQTTHIRSCRSYDKEMQEMKAGMLRDNIFLWHTANATQKFAVVIGDSFGAHMYPSMRAAGVQTGGGLRQFHYQTSSGCLPTFIGSQAISNYGPLGSNPSFERKCREMSETAGEIIRRQRPDTLVFVSRWQDYMTENFRKLPADASTRLLPLNNPMRRFSYTLLEAVKLADRVVVLGLTPAPGAKNDSLTCLWNQMDEDGLRQDAEKHCPQKFAVEKYERQWSDDFRNYLRRVHPKVHYIDVIRTSKMCGGDGTTCWAWNAETGPMHCDARGHLTREGAVAATSGVVF